MISIPYDIYESQHEFIIILPLGGVAKESIEIKIKDHTLLILGERTYGTLRKDCIPVQQNCYRGDIHIQIDLPGNILYKEMNSILSKDNILHIMIPKNTIPEKLQVTLEE